MADPLCTCGHAFDAHDDPSDMCARYACGCERYTVAGSLEDILGVWRDQGPFPLRNTDDVQLLVDEIVRLRAREAELLEFIGPPITLAELRAAIDRRHGEP